MKAVITSIVLIVATGSPVLAQTDVPPSQPTGTVPIVTPPPAPPRNVVVPPSPVINAYSEAVHRQANQMESRNKLEQAHAAELRKDLKGAAKLYDDAWALADSVGPSADAERQAAVNG